MKPVSHDLARFVADVRFAQLSPRAVEMTKRCLVDAVGVSLAASVLGEGVQPFIDLVGAQGGRPLCTVLGTDLRAPPEAAAFANGALAHALDYEDAHDVALVHPNASTVPAALAIAEAFVPVSGQELILAIAAGCEVVVRLSLALEVSLADYGWYPPPLLGAFGATAAASRLLRLDPRQICDAFSLTLCQATCAGEIIHSPHSVLRAVRDAFAARAGVSSALLAQRGVTGFEQPLEGHNGFFATFARGRYDPGPISRELGHRFEIENVSFKPWPSCRGTHAAIEAALACRAEHHLDPGTIRHVAVRGGPMLRILAEPIESKRRPATAIDAKFSLPFTVATAFARNRVSLDDFLPDALNDEEVLALAARVDVDCSLMTSRAIGAVIDVTLHDGRVCTHEVTRPLGSPDHPMSLESLAAKFSECAGHARRPIDGEHARRFVATALTLEHLDDVAMGLMRLLDAS